MDRPPPAPLVFPNNLISCAFINIDAELAYWRGCHERGHLGSEGFDVYAVHIKLAFDILLAHPRAREGHLMNCLRHAWQQLPEASALPWDDTHWLIRRVWHRVSR